MESFGFEANDSTFKELTTAYSESHRHYHNASHIDACLALLDRCGSQAEHVEEIEIALWFHDAVYEPLRRDNELASANWAREFLLENRAREGVSERVHRLIMVTEHDAPTATADESLLVDIDLSILGVDAKAYAEFEIKAREEYRQVPLMIYQKKRAEILQGFLNRKVIYNNKALHAELEAQARVNLAHAIERLQSGG